MKIRFGKKAMEVEMLVKIVVVAAVIVLGIIIGYMAFKSSAGEGGLIANLISSMKGGG
jgi:uncharacterized membrane protein